MRAAEYCASLDGGRIQCQLCPRACVLLDGESGECRTRLNENLTARCNVASSEITGGGEIDDAKTVDGTKGDRCGIDRRTVATLQ